MSVAGVAGSCLGVRLIHMPTTHPKTSPGSAYGRKPNSLTSKLMLILVPL
jgi:hypothetical protein